MSVPNGAEWYSTSLPSSPTLVTHVEARGGLHEAEGRRALPVSLHFHHMWPLRTDDTIAVLGGSELAAELPHGGLKLCRHGQHRHRSCAQKAEALSSHAVGEPDAPVLCVLCEERAAEALSGCGSDCVHREVQKQRVEKGCRCAPPCREGRKGLVEKGGDSPGRAPWKSKVCNVTAMQRITEHARCSRSQNVRSVSVEDV